MTEDNLDIEMDKKVIRKMIFIFVITMIITYSAIKIDDKIRKCIVCYNDNTTCYYNQNLEKTKDEYNNDVAYYKQFHSGKYINYSRIECGYPWLMTD